LEEGDDKRAPPISESNGGKRKGRGGPVLGHFGPEEGEEMKRAARESGKRPVEKEKGWPAAQLARKRGKREKKRAFPLPKKLNKGLENRRKA